jgi:hypothetical protein
MSTDSSKQTIKVKARVADEKEMRVFGNLSSFKELVAAVNGLDYFEGETIMTYNDSDGDTCRLTNEREWASAVEDLGKTLLVNVQGTKKKVAVPKKEESKQPVEEKKEKNEEKKEIIEPSSDKKDSKFGNPPPVERCPHMSKARKGDTWLIVDPNFFVEVNCQTFTAARLTEEMLPYTCDIGGDNTLFFIDAEGRAVVKYDDGKLTSISSFLGITGYTWENTPSGHILGPAEFHKRQTSLAYAYNQFEIGEGTGAFRGKLIVFDHRKSEKSMKLNGKVVRYQ